MSTYRDAGVDLDAADRLVGRIAGDVTATWDDSVVGGFGGFAGGIRMPAGLERPVLMMSTDGVGTKAEVARRAGRVDGLGFDLVAMCADDLAAAGARPIALTDYLTALGRMTDCRDFPFHIELRRDGAGVLRPIEVNPLLVLPHGALGLDARLELA